VGEAKQNNQRREDHARKIVTAFERFVRAIIANSPYVNNSGPIEYNEMIEAYKFAEAKEDLIKILVTPPPK